MSRRLTITMDDRHAHCASSIRLPDGHEVSEKGHARLEQLGVSKLPAAAAKIAQDLRKHIANIKDDTTRAFVEEAIRCHEVALYRSAIVMRGSRLSPSSNRRLSPSI